jgi:general secretion pathway protein J
MAAPARNGFTLVELMVALMIFGLLSAAGVSLMAFSVRAQAAANDRLGEIAALRRLNAILTADLAQVMPRIVRDDQGAALPAFVGGPGQAGAVAMGFVRGGWDNSGGAARPSLQRVEYRLEQGRLQRIAWPMLDGAQPRPAATILTGVRSFALRYRDDRDWRERWDPVRPTDLPRAVEVVVDVEGIGRVRQLFLAGPRV